MTDPILAAGGAPGTLLALLLAGHTLGDFVFQSKTMVARKGDSFRWLAAHASVVTAVHVAVLLPFFAGPGLLLVLILGAGHLILDRAKAWLGDASLAWFAADQGLHIAALFGVWRIWIFWLGAEPVFPYGTEELHIVTAAAILVSAYAFNVNGGGAIVAMVVHAHTSDEESDQGVGQQELSRNRVVGILERMIVLTLVLLGQWGAIGLLLVAKSIARFRVLENRALGDHFLIATLTSLLVATATGLAVKPFL